MFHSPPNILSYVNSYCFLLLVWHRQLNIRTLTFKRDGKIWRHMGVNNQMCMFGFLIIVTSHSAYSYHLSKINITMVYTTLKCYTQEVIWYDTSKWSHTFILINNTYIHNEERTYKWSYVGVKFKAHLKSQRYPINDYLSI